MNIDLRLLLMDMLIRELDKSLSANLLYRSNGQDSISNPILKRVHRSNHQDNPRPGSHANKTRSDWQYSNNTLRLSFRLPSSSPLKYIHPDPAHPQIHRTRYLS